MACAAVFAGIHVVHLHLPLRPLHHKCSGMALVATEYLGVKPVAERYAAHGLDLVGNGFLKRLHLVASSALRGRKCFPPVMTGPAVSPLIDGVHSHFTRTLLHLKDTCMAIFAAELCMKFVIELCRKPLCAVGECLYVVAGIADNGVSLHETVGLEAVALVTVIPAGEVNRVREGPFFPGHKLLVRVTLETGECADRFVSVNNPLRWLFRLFLFDMGRTGDRKNNKTDEYTPLHLYALHPVAL